MLELWAILLGWPAILVSLALSVIGIVSRRPKWLVVAAIIVVPFSLYLFGTLRFRWIALVFPVLLFGASIVIRRRLILLFSNLLTSIICIVINIKNGIVPLQNDHALLDIVFFYFNVPVITVFDAKRLSEISLIDSDTQVTA